jgi:hypothetical protein
MRESHLDRRLFFRGTTIRCVFPLEFWKLTHYLVVKWTKPEFSGFLPTNWEAGR